MNISKLLFEKLLCCGSIFFAPVQPGRSRTYLNLFIREDRKQTDYFLNCNSSILLPENNMVLTFSSPTKDSE